MPENMPDGMSDPITSSWYVRNYVRMVCQSGDLSKKAILAALFFENAPQASTAHIPMILYASYFPFIE